jgi:hypothetical protein
MRVDRLGFLRHAHRASCLCANVAPEWLTSRTKVALQRRNGLIARWASKESAAEEMGERSEHAREFE